MCELYQGSTAGYSRRRIMLGAGSMLAASALPFARAHADQPISSTPPPNAISPDAALERLMQGNDRYAANAPEEKDYSAGPAARVTAQFPIAAVLSCSDSRVAPELASTSGRATCSWYAWPATSSMRMGLPAWNMR
jgi:carbonic anhydrase